MASFCVAFILTWSSVKLCLILWHSQKSHAMLAKQFAYVISVLHNLMDAVMELHP